MITRRSALWLATATLMIMGGLGIVLIHYFREPKLWEFLAGRIGLLYQTLTGSVAGMAGAWVAWRIVSLGYLRDTRKFFSNLFSELNLSPFDVVFISLCAGIGEELLFRGGIQPFLGIWITSVLFVALHGYLNPARKPLMVYGIFMVFVIAAFGYMTEYIGILSAVIAHTILDIYLIARLVTQPE